MAGSDDAICRRLWQVGFGVEVLSPLTGEGVFERIFAAVSEDPIRYALIDGTIVKVHRHAYLQIVESRRGGDQVRQQVIARSAVGGNRLPAVITELAGQRKHGVTLERAVFLTVLHRPFGSGSDRAADRWREDYAIAGVDKLELHHHYRAVGWLGEELPEKEQDGRTPFAPRCMKDVVEERLFAHRRDLLTQLDLVFMDTASLCFEGAGGQNLGRRGYSKDHRPDLRQMILAVLIDGDGRPVCSEMWPGNTADVTTLIPVIDRLAGASPSSGCA